jgi:hypothetical protein
MDEYCSSIALPRSRSLSAEEQPKRGGTVQKERLLLSEPRKKNENGPHRKPASDYEAGEGALRNFTSFEASSLSMKVLHKGKGEGILEELTTTW